LLFKRDGGVMTRVASDLPDYMIPSPWTPWIPIYKLTPPQKTMKSLPILLTILLLGSLRFAVFYENYGAYFVAWQPLRQVGGRWQFRTCKCFFNVYHPIYCTKSLPHWCLQCCSFLCRPGWTVHQASMVMFHHPKYRIWQSAMICNRSWMSWAINLEFLLRENNDGVATRGSDRFICHAAEKIFIMNSWLNG
jgi:hypothetical protein